MTDDRKRQTHYKALKGRQMIAQGKRSAALSLRRILNMTLLAIGIILLPVAGYETYLMLITSPRFALSSIEIQGNQVMKEKSITSLGGIIKGRNIFTLDMERITSRIKSHPWIRDVEVSRRLPDGLQIHITERVPVALLKSKRNYVMDREGVVMAEVEDTANITLPVIEETGDFSGKPGDRVSSLSFFACLDLLFSGSQSSFLSKMGVKSLKPVGRTAIQLVTERGNIAIIFDKLYINDGLKKIDTLVGLIRDRGVETIDLSFNDLVVVK